VKGVRNWNKEWNTQKKHWTWCKNKTRS